MSKVPGSQDDPLGQDAVRARVISAGADILARRGRDALTTRSVAVAAGIQAPTIYRLFGDKEGLLDAVAEYGLATYVAEKDAERPLSDPIEDLRHGWNLHVEFSLTHPAIFLIIQCEPRPDRRSPAAIAGYENLRRRVGRVAAAGLLRVTEARAAEMLHAGGVGVILTLLEMPEDRRDPELSRAAREAIIGAITNTEPVFMKPGSASAAVALRASLGEASTLTPGERHLLTELLDRLAANPS